MTNELGRLAFEVRTDSMQHINNLNRQLEYLENSAKTAEEGSKQAVSIKIQYDLHSQSKEICLFNIELIDASINMREIIDNLKNVSKDEVIRVLRKSNQLKDRRIEDLTKYIMNLRNNLDLELDQNKIQLC